MTAAMRSPRRGGRPGRRPADGMIASASSSLTRTPEVSVSSTTPSATSPTRFAIAAVDDALRTSRARRAWRASFAAFAATRPKRCASRTIVSRLLGRQLVPPHDGDLAPVRPVDDVDPGPGKVARVQVAKALDRHRVGIGVEDRPRVVVRVGAGLVRREQGCLGGGDHGCAVDAALGAQRGEQILERTHACPDGGGRSAHARRSAASARTTRGARIVTDSTSSTHRLDSTSGPGPRIPARPTRLLRRRSTSGAPPPFRFSSPATSAAQRPRRRWPRRVVFGLLWLALAIVSAFYGFATAIAQDVQNLDAFQSRPTANGVIYAGDGHTVLAILRSPNENRKLVAVRPDREGHEAGDRRDRGQALLRARRDRPDRPRARGGRRPDDRAARRAARRSRSSSSRTSTPRGSARCSASSSRPCSRPRSRRAGRRTTSSPST